MYAASMTQRKDDRLWGGRFEREPDKHFDAFQRSFAFDRRLLPYELAVDRAWAKALEPVGIFTAAEVKQTLAALDKIALRAQNVARWVPARLRATVLESTAMLSRGNWASLASRQTASMPSVTAILRSIIFLLLQVLPRASRGLRKILYSSHRRNSHM